MAVSDYSTTPGSNTSISGINIAEGCSPANINNAIRQLMADVKSAYDGLTIGQDVQAYDAGLQSIAGLTTAADRMIYTTAADTYAVATLTAAGRAILDDADAAAQRTTLGLAIGTDVQAYDADLAAIAALSPTKGNLLVGNGTAWVAVGVGTNNQVLVADSAEAAGVNWATPSSSAPSTSDVLAATAGAAVGAVGTYALLEYDVNTSSAPGVTSAGSNLLYGNAAGTSAATNPSGTWQLMARTTNASNAASTALWLRIS